MSDDLELRIAKINLEPGDVFVLRSDGFLSAEMADRLRDIIKRAIPGVKALILEKGMEISVLTGADLQKRLESA